MEYLGKQQFVWGSDSRAFKVYWIFVFGFWIRFPSGVLQCYWGVLTLCVTLAHEFSKSDLPRSLGASAMLPSSSHWLLSNERKKFSHCVVLWVSRLILVGGKEEERIEEPWPSCRSASWRTPSPTQRLYHWVSAPLSIPSSKLGETGGHGLKSRKPQ